MAGSQNNLENMNEEKDEVLCKFFQTGFCKYKENCSQKHDHTICENQNDCNERECTNRHPKICQNFRKDGKCVFKEKCAYQHTPLLNNQAKVMEAMMKVILKQQQDITALTEEVKILKDLMNKIAMEKIDGSSNKETDVTM